MSSAVPKEEVSGIAVFDCQAELSLGQGIRVPTSFHSRRCHRTVLPQPSALLRDSQEMRSSGGIQIRGYILVLQSEVRKRAHSSFFSCSWKALLLPNIYARLAPKKQQCRIPLLLGAVQADKT